MMQSFFFQQGKILNEGFSRVLLINDVFQKNKMDLYKRTLKQQPQPKRWYLNRKRGIVSTAIGSFSSRYGTEVKNESAMH